jgi:protein subunit release factor B
VSFWAEASVSKVRAIHVQGNDHPAAASPEQLWADSAVRRLRRSEPGGQHRNKVETAINLHHLPTGVHAEASERRSQAQNRSETLFRLRVNPALKVRRPCGPDYTCVSRNLFVLWRAGF